MKLEPKIIELLHKRGIESEEDMEEFLSDRPRKTYDPFLLLNMEAGVDLLMSAIEDDEKICIYGDYDTDGITSTVLMLEVLSNLTNRLMYYIPSRFGEGYGLNKEAVRKIHGAGAGMILTVDLGSVSVEEVEYAKSLGMKVLVTDHHNVTDKKADCLIINPHQPGCPYPFKELAGCGVAFKLAQALVRETGLPKSVLSGVLDLVGIGTIGDIVDLVDENRTLAKFGLRAINSRHRKNLDILIRRIGLKPGQVTSEQVSFGIVPHLNAAGRMKHAKVAAELLLTGDEKTAELRAEELVRLNGLRKKIQEEIYQECIRRVETEYLEDDLLLVDLDEANEGVTGIACGKLKDTYYKPSIIIARLPDGKAKGTARSVEGLDMYQLLKTREDLFQAFGGHEQACGFTMQAADIETLRKDLTEKASGIREKDPSIFERKILAELELEPQDINMALVDQLELLEPTGCANEKPKLSFRALPEDLSRMGKNKEYLRFRAQLRDRRRITCTVFRNADEIEQKLLSGGAKNLIGSLRKNYWNGNTELVMQIAEVD